MAADDLTSAAVDAVVIEGRRLLGDDVRDAAATASGPLVLRDCDLTGESLRGLHLGGWTFEDCVLDDAVLTGADLSGSAWRRGSARRAKLLDADLVDASFQTVDLSGARLTGTLLTDTVFDGCRAMGAYLDRTRGMGVTFRSCNMYAAQLDGLTFGARPLVRLRLDEASLRNTDLRNCALEECSLVGADLTGAQMSGADLRGAALGECDADRLACLRGAIINPDQATAVLAQVAGVIVS